MTIDDLLQLSASGGIAGSAFALNGVAFALIWNVTQRFHFAYAFIYAFAAYIAATASGLGGLWIALLAGALAGAALGATTEVVLYRPLAARSGHNALLTVFIAALGLNIAGQNLLSLIWIDEPTQQISGAGFDAVTIGPVSLTTLDLEMVGASWALIVALALGLSYSSWGRTARATQANPEMATVIGLRPRLTCAGVFAVGSLLAGVAAVFAGAKTAVTAEMGFRPMFYAFVVAFLAGNRASPLRVGVLGLAVGLLESWSTLFIASQWSPLIVFGVLFVYAAQKAVDLGSIRRRVGVRAS